MHNLSLILIAHWLESVVESLYVCVCAVCCEVLNHAPNDHPMPFVCGFVYCLIIESGA